MSLKYFGSTKSIGLIPFEEEGRDRSFVQDTPAYLMIWKILKSKIPEEEKQQQLRFFTQWGHKRIIGSTTIESTPSDNFNVQLGEKVFTTYHTQYMQIVSAIDNGNEAQLKAILEEISKDIVNIKLISEYFPKATVQDKDISIVGSLGTWKVNLETLQAFFNDRTICIVSRGKYTKNTELSEKEEILLAKLLVCNNDKLYVSTDIIIKSQVERILERK